MFVDICVCVWYVMVNPGNIPTLVIHVNGVLEVWPVSVNHIFEGIQHLGCKDRCGKSIPFIHDPDPIGASPGSSLGVVAGWRVGDLYAPEPEGVMAWNIPCSFISFFFA